MTFRVCRTHDGKTDCRESEPLWLFSPESARPDSGTTNGSALDGGAPLDVPESNLSSNVVFVEGNDDGDIPGYLVARIFRDEDGEVEEVDVDWTVDDASNVALGDLHTFQFLGERGDVLYEVRLETVSFHDRYPNGRDCEPSPCRLAETLDLDD